MAPRALSHIFNEIGSRMEFEFKVTCTFVELYGEKIFDLLTDLARPNQTSEFTIAEDVGGRGVFVRGLNEVEARTENEALNLLFSGELARTTAQHKLNKKSNRSHSIFTVYLQQRHRSGVSEKVVHSKLHLVDLAGSERLKKTHDTTDGSASDEITRRESMVINQSLTYLEQCVVALARKGHSHVPYRQSRLTNMLKDVLGANCNTLMMACIWGEASHLEETISTLRLASRMMKVQNETTVVESVDSAALIKKQARLIRALKQELSMHDALVERTGVEYEPYTPEQQTGIRQMIEQYVDAKEVDEDECLRIDSFRTMLEVCSQFKRMVLNARAEASAAREDAYLRAGEGGPRTAGSEYAATPNFASESKYAEDGETGQGGYVGEPEEDFARSGGFSLGVAPADSKPASVDRGRFGDAKAFSANVERKNDSNDGSPGKKSSTQGISFDSTGLGGDTMAVGGSGNENQRLLEKYVQTGHGRDVYSRFSETRGVLKERKRIAKELINTVNDAKAEIDNLQVEIDRRKFSRIELLKSSGFKSSEMEDIVDEEEFQLMKALKEAKRKYKNSYEQLQKVKSTVTDAQNTFDKAKSIFSSEFEEWNLMRERSGFAGDDAGQRDGTDGYEKLDDNEAFERLEVERVMARDPDSLAFFNAQKTRRAHQTQNSTSIKQILKNKRVG